MSITETCSNCNVHLTAEITNATSKKGHAQKIESTKFRKISIQLSDCIDLETVTYKHKTEDQGVSLPGVRMHSAVKIEEIPETNLYLNLCPKCGADDDIVWKSLMKLCGRFGPSAVARRNLDTIVADVSEEKVYQKGMAQTIKDWLLPKKKD